MPASKKKKIRKARKKSILEVSNVVVVTHTTGKEILFPKKLAKVNNMLRNAQFVD